MTARAARNAVKHFPRFHYWTAPGGYCELFNVPDGITHGRRCRRGKNYLLRQFSLHFLPAR